MVAVNCAKNSSFFWTLFLMKGGKILDYSHAGHWTSRKHFRKHSRLYLSLVLVLFQARKAPWICFAHLYTPYDIIATKMMWTSGRAYPHAYTVQVWSKSDWHFLRYWHFCTYPPTWPFPNLTIIRPPSIWNMASEPTPQQLITQCAQATADTIANALTARTASISLPIYNWDSQDAYHSFSIFHHTLENCLLLNCILPDSKDHLRYIFAALGT